MGPEERRKRVLSNFDNVGVISWTDKDWHVKGSGVICLSTSRHWPVPSSVTERSHLEYDVLAVVCLEPAILSLEFFLPPDNRAPWYLQQNRVWQFLSLNLLIKLKIEKTFQQMKWFIKIISMFFKHWCCFSDIIQFVIGYKIFRIVLKNSEIIVTMSQRNTDIDIFEMTSIYFKLCRLAGCLDWPPHYKYLG